MDVIEERTLTVIGEALKSELQLLLVNKPRYIIKIAKSLPVAI